MSDTTAGLLQVGLLLAALAVVLPAAGRLHGPGLHQRARHPRRSGSSTGSMGVDPKADQRWPVYARALLAFSAVSVLVPVRAAAVPAAPAADPGLPRRRAGPGVQHRGLVRDQHQLAVLLGRVDDGPPGPDGRARGAELRLRRRRHGRRGRADPRLRPLAHRPGRQLLGRPGARLPCASCCRSRSSARRPGRAGRRPELLRRHRR